MALKVVTASTGYPVTLDDLKDHLRITSTNEDILLRNYIKVATRQAENHMKRQTCTATYQLTLKEFSDEMELPRPPLAATTSVSITYIDSTGGSTTLASSIYDIDVTTEPAVIRLAYEQSWPGTRDVYNAVTIQYEAGYRVSTLNDEVTVPDEIKHWIMLTCGDYYENREGISAGMYVPKKMPFMDALLDEYIVHNTGGF